VLDQQHARYDFGRRLMTTQTAALLMPLALRFEHGVQQFVILQDRVHFPHPRLPQFRYFFSEKSFPQTWLCVSQAAHAA